MSEKKIDQEGLQKLQWEFFAAIGLDSTAKLVGREFAWGFRIKEGWVGWTGVVGSVFITIHKDDDNHMIKVFPTTTLTVELKMERKNKPIVEILVEIIGLEREAKNKHWLPILRDWRILTKEEWERMGGDLHLLP